MLQADKAAARLRHNHPPNAACMRPALRQQGPGPNALMSARHFGSVKDLEPGVTSRTSFGRRLARRASPKATLQTNGGGATAERRKRQQVSNGKALGVRKGDIFGRLLELQDMEEARRMVAEEGENFSPANSSTALKRVAYLSQGLSPKERDGAAQEPLLAELRSLVDSRMPSMQPPQLADIIWAYGRMEINPGTAMLESIAATCEAKSERLTPADITKLMWGYAKLHFVPTGLLNRISERLSLDPMDEFTAHSVSNMVWACATLNYRNPALLAKLAEVSKGRLAEFAPQGLSNTLWGFATLGHRDQELLDGIATEARKQLCSFTTKGLVNLLWCYGVFGYSPSQLLPEALEEAGKRMYKGTPVDVSNLAVTCARLNSAPPCVMAAIIDRAEASIGLFQPAELSGLVWALGRLEHETEPKIQQGLLTRACQISKDLNPTEVTNALYGLSRLSGSSSASGEDLQQLVERANELLPMMDAATASCSVQALARLSVNIPPSAALASFVAESKALLTKEAEQPKDLLPIKETVLLLWAFAKLERRVARWFVNTEGDWQEGTARVQRHLPAPLLDTAMSDVQSLSGHDLALLIWACGALRQPLPADRVALLSSRTAQLMGTLGMMEISMCVWGLAKMEFLDEDLMDLLAAFMESKLLGPCCPQDVAMLLCSCAVLPYRNIPMIGMCVSWIVEHVEDLSVTDVCNTMWAMAELYYAPGLSVLQLLEGKLNSKGVELRSENRSTMRWARRRLLDIAEVKAEQRQARQRENPSDNWMSNSSAAANRARRARFDGLDGSIWDAISNSSMLDDLNDV